MSDWEIVDNPNKQSDWELDTSNKKQKSPSKNEAPQYYLHPGTGARIPTNESARKLSQEQSEASIDTFRGIGKSLGNTPQEFANIFRERSQDIPFPYKNQNEEIGGVAGDIGTFFLPGGSLKGILKGATYLPKIGKGANAITKAIENSPLIKNALNIGRTGLETAIMGVRKNPQQSAGETATQGATGAGLQTLLNAVLSKNPIVNFLAKAGLGAGGGYLGGKATGTPAYESVPLGLGTAFGMGPLLRELGVVKSPVSKEFLSDVKTTIPESAKQRLESNRSLQTAIRPSEALNNTSIGSKEGNIPFSVGGAQEMAEQEAIRTKEHQAAINKLLDEIHVNTPEAKQEIRTAYKNANKWNMNEKFMDSIEDDPVINQAIHKVETTPALKKDLNDIPKNNVMYLDQVKRAMDDMRSAALRRGDKNEARIINETANKFTKEIDKSVPEYARARDLSQRSIVRSQISKALNKGRTKEINGYQFYTKILANDDAYNKLYQSLKNVPEAQAMLKNMKQGWDTLIPPQTVRASFAKSSSSMDKVRSSIHGLMIHFKNLVVGGKRDVERAKFIYSKDWEKEFANIQKMENQIEKRNAMIKLIAKSVGAEETAK